MLSKEFSQLKRPALKSVLANGLSWFLFGVGAVVLDGAWLLALAIIPVFFIYEQAKEIGVSRKTTPVLYYGLAVVCSFIITSVIILRS